MKVVLQRVLKASVTINGVIFNAINSGLLVLVGIQDSDTNDDIAWMSNKITNLRIFDDAEKIPNISIKESAGNILLVSQFTLHASTKKGNRPSYLLASKPIYALPIYNKFITQLQTDLGKKIYTGEFGADMQVALINDGPITILIDSKNKE
jgi:D-aminoacyl-tRNA deacylase